MGPPEQPKDYLPDPACGQLLQRYEEAIRAGRLQEADAIAGNLLALAGQRALENPGPELLLQMHAQRCEAAADWPGAEAVYRQLLERAVRTGEVVGQYKAYSDLSELYQLLGQAAVALEPARAATEAARRAEMPTLLAMALEKQAGYALRLDHVSEARTSLDEALRSLGSDRMYDHQRGRCLVLLAECRLRSGDALAADHDLEAAQQHLEALIMEGAAGVQAAMAHWWTVKARLQGVRGDWSGADRAWAMAVAGRRHVADLPQVRGPQTQNGLAETLWAYGQALLSVGRPRAAEELLAESRAIRDQLGLPLLEREQEPC